VARGEAASRLSPISGSDADEPRSASIPKIAEPDRPRASPPNAAGTSDEGAASGTVHVPWDFTETPQPLEPSSAVAPRPTGDTLGRPLLVRPTSVAPEELTLLVQRIFNSGAAGIETRSVLFSALGPECGSASICAAAADVLAGQTTASVCLVDANLRSPSLHVSFGLNGARGLSDALLDAGDVRSLLTKVRGNLWLLPGGLRCADAAPFLTAEQLRPRVLELLAAFDYLIVDTSPASLHSDAGVLGHLVDGVVLVVEANGTRREAARRTTEHLQAANIRLLGAVLTNRTFPIPETIYRRLRRRALTPVRLLLSCRPDLAVAITARNRVFSESFTTPV